MNKIVAFKEKSLEDRIQQLEEAILEQTKRNISQQEQLTNQDNSLQEIIKVIKDILEREEKRHMLRGSGL